MASYDVNRINVSLIKQYKDIFETENTRFNNGAYNTFISCYLNNSSDSYVQSMTNNLKRDYEQIKIGYKTINRWWSSYNSNIESLENSLAIGNSDGVELDSIIMNFINTNLPFLGNYQSYINYYDFNPSTSNEVFVNNDIINNLIALYPFLASVPPERLIALQEQLDNYNDLLVTLENTTVPLNEQLDYYKDIQTRYRMDKQTAGIDIVDPYAFYQEGVTEENIKASKEQQKQNSDMYFQIFLENNDLVDLEIQTETDLDKIVSDLEGQIKQIETSAYYTKQLLKTLPYSYIKGNSDYSDKTSYDNYKNVDIKNGTAADILTQISALNMIGLTYFSSKGYDYNVNDPTIKELIDETVKHYEEDIVKYLSDDEINNYNYLFATKGKDTAEKYLETIKDVINQRQGAYQAKDFLEYLNKEADFTKFFSVGWEGTKDGITTFFEGLDNIFNADGITSANQYKQMMIIQALGNKLEDPEFVQLCKDYGVYEQILGYTYKFGTTFGNMAPTIVASVILNAAAAPMLGASTAATIGKIGGTTLMGLSSGGNAIDQALSRGAEGYQAVIYGILTGLSESTLEYFLGNIPGLGENTSLSIKGLLKEGGEEGLQEILGAIFAKTTYGEPINIDELSGGVTESFVMGILMAGLMNGTQKVAVKYGGKIINVTTDKLVKLVNDFNNAGIAENFKLMLESDVASVDSSTNSEIGLELRESMLSPEKQAVLLKIDNFGEWLQSKNVPDPTTGVIDSNDVLVTNQFIERLRNVIYNSDNGEAVKMLSLVDEFQKRNPEFVIQFCKNMAAYASESKELEMPSQIVLSIANSNFDTVVIHEFLGHGYHDIANGEAIPSNFLNITERAYEQAYNDPIKQQELYEVVKGDRDMVNGLADRFRNNWDNANIPNEIIDSINNVDNIDLGTVKKALQSDGVEGIEDYTEEQLKIKYLELLRENYALEQVHKYVRNDPKQDIRKNASDIISAMIQGKNNNQITFSNGKSLRLIGLHSEEYYSKEKSGVQKGSIFLETIAQFSTLRNSGKKGDVALAKLKSIFGDEWYNMVETEYNKFYTNLSANKE